MGKIMKLSIIIIMLIFACGCAQQTQQIPLVKSKQGKIQEPETPSIVTIKPILIEAELITRISNIKIFEGDQLKRNHLKKGVPALSPPQLHVWSSGIIKRPNQTILELDIQGPLPNDISTDFENGNRIFYWNLTNQLGNQDSIVIRRELTIESTELVSIIDEDNIAEYDETENLFLLYTKSEPFIELTPEIYFKAKEIVAEEKNSYRKAKLIFQWVNENMKFRFSRTGRGAKIALKKLYGDSGQYSDLFVALCRASKIPARMVAGFRLDENDKLKNHLWAEFYLPGYEWLPADPTQGMAGFARMENRRFIASVGRNIPLKESPHWATFHNSEVQDSRTGFMLSATYAFCGIKLKFKTSIKTISVRELQKEFSTNKEE